MEQSHGSRPVRPELRSFDSVHCIHHIAATDRKRIGCGALGKTGQDNHAASGSPDHPGNGGTDGLAIRWKLFWRESLCLPGASVHGSVVRGRRGLEVGADRLLNVPDASETLFWHRGRPNFAVSTIRAGSRPDPKAVISLWRTAVPRFLRSWVRIPRLSRGFCGNVVLHAHMTDLSVPSRSY